MIVATLVATLLSSISSEFNSSHQASWLGTAYLLATCTFTPLYGRLSNAMGRRGANQLALAFTAIGTLGCGLSKDMWSLVFFRFVCYSVLWEAVLGLGLMCALDCGNWRWRFVHNIEVGASVVQVLPIHGPNFRLALVSLSPTCIACETGR